LISFFPFIIVATGTFRRDGHVEVNNPAQAALRSE
jgi:hypothetical protein